MILLDTNIFVIDRFFRRDDRYGHNSQLISIFPQIEVGFSIFSLLELCGISSFNLSTLELRRWMYSFEEIYAVEILHPRASREPSAQIWLSSFFASVFGMIERRATLGDAFVLQTAEEYDAEILLTWNPKDFSSRIPLPVMTPVEFLAQRRRKQ